MKQYITLGLALAALLLAAPDARAQTNGGVGIGTTAPDASAALDIVSSGKGVLLPRVADATALTSPATGLIVYQTGGTPGFYYNAGTPAAPSWQRLAGAGTAGTDYVRNQTTQQANSSFNVDGAGTVGGLLTASGGAAVTGNTTINPAGGATTTIGGGNTGSTLLGGRNITIGSTASVSAIDIAKGDNSVTTIGSGASNNVLIGGGYGSYVVLGSDGGVVVNGGTATFNAPTVTMTGSATIGAGNGSTTNIGTGTSSGAVTIGHPRGTVKVANLNASQVVTTNASGNLSSATAASLDATTASNGLTRTGQDVQLGGTLTQNTTVALGSSSLTVAGAAGTQAVSQPSGPAIIPVGSAGGSIYFICQTFTLPAGAVITQVAVYQAGGSAVPGQFQFTNNNSNNSGTQNVNFAAAPAATLLVPTQPYTVASGGSNNVLLQLVLTANTGFSGSTANPYVDGVAINDFNNSNLYASPNDLKFTLTYFVPGATAPTLYVAAASSVGVGTSSPTALLDVAGSTRLRGLTTPGVVTTDASGNLSSQAPTTYGGTDFIQNQTSSPQAGGFRLGGTGTATALQATGPAAAITEQGAFLQWNRSGGEGETWLLNQKGGGNLNAGIRFGKSDAADNATEWARFLDNGNLGLGTTAPGQKLDVSGSANVSGSSYVGGSVGIGTSSPATRLSISPATTEAKITLYDGGLSHYGFGVSGGQLNYHVLSTSDQHVFWAKGKNGETGSVELLRIRGDGRVGIGTSSPAQTLDVAGSATVSGRVGIGTAAPVAPLHVSGNASVAAAGTKAYFNQASASLATDPSTAARNVVAYFTGGQLFVNDYIVAGALTTTSDRRIKRVLGLSDRGADLALLNKLRITDYTYIDQHANTDKVVKKVIAQEVREVLPAAVSQSRQAIPNVYERATRVSFAEGYVTLTTARPHELPATGGTLRLYTAANQELTVTVAVVDAHTVRFASAVAYPEGLFVYGRYVDDFLSVDYDALTTLNVSATQELARRVQVLEQQNAALQVRAAQAEADHADLQALKAQMARLLGEAPAGAQARK